MTNRLKGLLATIAILFVYSTAQAQTYQITNGGGGFACITEDYLDEIMDAVMAENSAWGKSLIAAGKCTIMPKGANATMKDRGFTVSQIYLQLTNSGRPIVLWTANENFRRR